MKRSLTDLNPTTTAPPTYARGTKCIDYFLGTPKVKQSVLAHGFLPFYGGAWHSDHRAIFIDLDTRILFEGDTAEFETDTTTKRTTATTQAKQTNSSPHLQKKNKLQAIEDRPQSTHRHSTMVKQHHTQFEKLDTQFTKALTRQPNSLAKSTTQLHGVPNFMKPF